MKIIPVGFISLNSQKKRLITIDDDLILFSNSTIFSNPIAILKRGRLVKIKNARPMV